MEMVERATQLVRLRDALAQARRGHGSTVLLSGEAGIGKTTLLRAFVEPAVPQARVFEGWCDELITPRTLGPFRDIADRHPAVFAAVLDDRDAFIDALTAEMSFRQRPAVVIIEDLQWADHATFDIIGFLGRRIQSLPALLVASYRDDDVSGNEPLQRLLGSLAGDSTIRIHLDGLSDIAVGRLARAAGMDPVPVIATVGGNPFYLSEVIMHGTPAVPPSVRDAVAARVSALPARCRVALGQIAVIPSEVDVHLLGRIVDDLSDLEPAERRRILEFTPRGLRFRHEIARRVVESSLSDAQRVTCHARVLAALVAAQSEKSLLVHHAMGARDQAAAAVFAAAAATEASRADSHEETVAYARLALDRAHILTTPERARLHGLAARGLYALNRFGEAAVHADDAVGAWDGDGGSTTALAEALLLSARINTLLGRPTAGRDKALRAITILQPGGPSHDLAFAYSTLAAQAALRADVDAARTWSERALDVAYATGSDDIVSHALGYRGVAKCSAGDDSGLDDLRSAVEIATRIGHADFLTVAAHNLAVMLMRSGDVLAASPYLDIADRVAREHRLETARFRISAQQCFVLMWQGRWDEAESRLRGLVGAGADAGANAVNPLAFLGRLLSRRNDPAGAELIERACALAAASGEDQKSAVASAAKLESLWLSGDTAGVRAIGAKMLDRAGQTERRLLHGELLRYLRRVGDTVKPFPGCPAPFAAGIAGDWERAATLWEQAGNPYEQAWELSESPDVAVVLRALDMFDRLGAAAAATIVRRRLRSAGVRGVPRGPRVATQGNPGRLTNRQLEILALVNEGATNGEIANRLFLSRRTVDNHVSALLRRLNVTSRHAAIAAGSAAGVDRGATKRR
jgi:DNA-binding CsgD family transcriptional regulator